MGLTIGIVGLPNVGKSTLFNAMTHNEVLAENYPFATIDPNLGIVDIPDNKLKILAKMFNSKKIVPATVSFVDIAGIVKGASVGEGLGNQFLANIRECNAICQVVRAFSDSNVVHVQGNKFSPKDDIETINTELILADIQTLENAIARYTKEVTQKRNDPKVLEVAKNAFEILNNGKTLKESGFNADLIKELGLLTAKNFIFVFNCDEEILRDKQKQQELRQLVPFFECVFIDSKFEHELNSLNEADAIEMLGEIGKKESGLSELARIGFETLGLQYFYTAGEKETRAWTINKGDTAPQAAGVIHTDFEKGFIKAQVISFDDLVQAGSLKNAWDLGKVRIEGKEYKMQPDDIVEFRFNN